MCLPKGLLHLNLGSLSMDEGAQQRLQSLEVFNTFQELQSLDLGFAMTNGNNILQVRGELNLPCLQHLGLQSHEKSYQQKKEGTVMLSLTLNGIPAACHVKLQAKILVAKDVCLQKLKYSCRRRRCMKRFMRHLTHHGLLAQVSGVMDFPVYDGQDEPFDRIDINVDTGPNGEAPQEDEEWSGDDNKLDDNDWFLIHRLTEL